MDRIKTIVCTRVIIEIKIYFENYRILLNTVTDSSFRGSLEFIYKLTGKA